MLLTPQNTKVSFAISKWEKLTVSEGLVPIEKPERKPLSIVAVIILLRASMTIMNRKEDKRITLPHPMRATEESGWSVVNQDEKTCRQNAMRYQRAPFPPKPHLFSKFNKNFQLM